MSKDTSPQSRSTSGPRSSARGRGRVKAASPSAARVAKTVGKETKARRATGPVTWRSRLRRMFLVVAVPNLVVFFSLAAIYTATEFGREYVFTQVTFRSRISSYV